VVLIGIHGLHGLAPLTVGPSCHVTSDSSTTVRRQTGAAA
jgi:hypothetical protein